MVVVDLEREFPDRRFEAAELPFDGFPEVLQQVEAISDLSRLRRALPRGVRIKTSAITADNFDFRMPPEPVRRGGSGAICQQINYLTTLQIDDDGPVVRAFPPGPPIDAGDTHHGAIGLGSAAILYAPQDRGVAHGHAEPAHQSLGWSTTDAVAEQSDDPGQAGGPACERGGQPRMPLGEDPTIALVVSAPPARQPRLYGNGFPWAGRSRSVR